jgi:hypothetical protein
MRFKLSAKALPEIAIAVGPLQPSGDGEGVLLVKRSSCD